MNNTPTPAALARIIDVALYEDIGKGDVTTQACIPAEANGRGVLLAKAGGIICGVKIAEQVFRAVDPAVRFIKPLRDGDAVKHGTVIATVRGPLRSLLTAERTALNFLQRLSGIATATNAFVRRVHGTGATILDTRKTTPLLRELEKYAVRTGGAQNHRAKLDAMVLIKDNHIAAAGGIIEAVARCRAHKVRVPVEVETTTLEQVRDVLSIRGVDRIMLDNYSLPQIRAAVKLVAHRIPLEVSGGVNLKTVRAIANTGVEFISVGAITHSAEALDISFEIE